MLEVFWVDPLHAQKADIALSQTIGKHLVRGGLDVEDGGAAATGRRVVAGFLHNSGFRALLAVANLRNAPPYTMLAYQRHKVCRLVALMDPTAPDMSSPDSTPVLPDATRRLRLVLEHSTGPLAGVMQIMGCSDEEGVPSPLPDLIAGIERPGASVIDASLIRIRRGAAYYREITEVEGLGRFDRMQK